MKTAFINGIILDGTLDMEPVKGKVIYVDGDTIINITNDDTVSDEFEIIDLKGQYVLPGLINLHVHLAGSGKPKKKASDPVKLVKLITSNGLMRSIGKAMVAKYAKTQLLSGVTTIRTVGGIADFDSTIRDRIKNGSLTGPRILASNKAISVPGGHMAKSLAYEATSPEEASLYVEQIAKDKPDIIKLMITGGVMDAEVVGEPGVLRMPAEYVKSACEKAHSLGFKVAAHVESPEGVKVALANGVDSIEHGAKPDNEIIELFKKTGSYHIATLSPSLPYALFDREISHATYEQHENGKIVFDGIIEMAKACLENNIPVGLGTDTACPYITQYDMWRELYYFAKYCNVSNSFAIYSATSLNAKLAGIDNITGTIEKGKKAEFITVSNNPLDNLQALRHVNMVVMNGKIHKDIMIKKYEEVEKELDKFL